MFIAANLLITVISAIVCSNVIGGGIVSLCKMKADSDSPVALAMLGVLIQGIMLVLKPEMMDPSVVCIYFSVAGTALFFNLVGKKMLINRVQRNFHFLTGEREKYAFLQVKNPGICAGVHPGTGRGCRSGSVQYKNRFYHWIFR